MPTTPTITKRKKKSNLRALENLLSELNCRTIKEAKQLAFNNEEITEALRACGVNFHECIK